MGMHLRFFRQVDGSVWSHDFASLLVLVTRNYSPAGSFARRDYS